MIKFLQRHGNSRALVIEKPLMEAVGIGDETPLQVVVDGRNIVITPADGVIGPDRIRASIKKLRRRYGPMLRRLAD